MGHFPRCSGTPSDSKPYLFDQAERAAFVHVGQALRDMPFCSLADLCQAAKSYFFQSVNASGAGHLFGERYVEAKAERLAAWWYRKHQDRRTPRPHTKYTPAQAQRGREVAAIRKRVRADWTALQAQLSRDRGDQLAQIAAELGCSLRTVSRLSKRLFPRIVGVVLAHFYGWTHGKSSVVSTSDIQAIDSKEPLPCGMFDEGASRATDGRGRNRANRGGNTGHPAGTVGRATALSGKNSSGHPAGHRLAHPAGPDSTDNLLSQLPHRPGRPPNRGARQRLQFQRTWRQPQRSDHQRSPDLTATLLLAAAERVIPER